MSTASLPPGSGRPVRLLRSACPGRRAGLQVDPAAPRCKGDAGAVEPARESGLAGTPSVPASTSSTAENRGRSSTPAAGGLPPTRSSPATRSHGPQTHGTRFATGPSCGTLCVGGQTIVSWLLAGDTCVLPSRPATERPRDRAPRGVCDHAPDVTHQAPATTRRPPLPSSAPSEHGDNSRHDPHAYRLRARSSPAERSASRCRGVTDRWAIRWAEPCRIRLYQGQRRTLAFAMVCVDLQVFRRLDAPRTRCFTRERSQVRNPPRPCEIRPSAVTAETRGVIRGSKRPRVAPVIGLVWEAHELPDQRLVDLAALHALGIDGERHPRILVSQLAHDPAKVTTGKGAQACERPAERVWGDARGEQHPALLGAFLVDPLHHALGRFRSPRAGVPFRSRLRTLDGLRRHPVHVGKIGNSAPWASRRRAGTAAR
jgi:hypothetical protein